MLIFLGQHLFCNFVKRIKSGTFHWRPPCRDCPWRRRRQFVEWRAAGPKLGTNICRLFYRRSRWSVHSSFPSSVFNVTTKRNHLLFEETTAIVAAVITYNCAGRTASVQPLCTFRVAFYQVFWVLTQRIADYFVWTWLWFLYRKKTGKSIIPRQAIQNRLQSKREQIFNACNSMVKYVSR